MSPAEHALRVQVVAREIDPPAWRLRDGGTFPPDHEAAQAIVRRSIATAERVLVVLGLGPTS